MLQHTVVSRNQANNSHTHTKNTYTHARARARTHTHTDIEEPSKQLAAETGGAHLGTKTTSGGGGGGGGGGGVRGGGGGAIDLDEQLLLFAATGGHVPAALVPMCNADQLLERVPASIYVS